MGRYAALATVAVTLALAGGTATVAHAAAPACKTVVTDDAGVLSPAELTALTKHAAGLAAKTELRIRTERSSFTGTLNGDEGSLQQDCGWADQQRRATAAAAGDHGGDRGPADGHLPGDGPRRHDHPPGLAGHRAEEHAPALRQG